MHCSYQNDNRMYSILRIKTIFTIFNELTRSGQLRVFSPVIVHNFVEIIPVLIFPYFHNRIAAARSSWNCHQRENQKRSPHYFEPHKGNHSPAIRGYGLPQQL